MIMRAIGWGLVAGAAGTTALNAITYLDMAIRGRPASDTPEKTIERLSEVTHVPVPGDEEARGNRLAGLGPLSGNLAGLAPALVLALLRAAGWRPPALVEFGSATLLAMISGNGPMTVLHITDPRSWSAGAWLSDVIPHLAYGAVVSATLRGVIR